MRRISGPNRAVGAAAGSTLALALLVCGCVFAALAGPALSLHTRSEALHQTLAGVAPTIKTVQVSGDLAGFMANLGGTGSTQDLTQTQLTESSGEIGRGLAALPLPLAPGAWAGLSTKLLVISSGAAPTAMVGAFLPPRLEVAYRDRLMANAQLVTGTYATAAVPPGAVGVAATPQTAARFGLHPGSRLQLTTPTGAVTLDVTAIVGERGAASTFRTAVLASLTSSPLQHAAALIMVLITAEAAALGLFIVILGLALGSQERELTMARLTVMGHQRDTRLVMTEAMPAVVVAVVAGVACAAVLPRLIGSSIDLSAFTGTSAPVQFQPDVTALGLPAAAAVVLALVALTAEARTMRRHGITGIMRAE